MNPPWVEHFNLPTGGTLPAPWAVTDVSAAGAPTLDYTGSPRYGRFELVGTVNDEAQQLALHWGDHYGITGYKGDLRNIVVMSFTFELELDAGGGQVTMPATHRAVLGYAQTYNANLDAITRYARLALTGNNNLLIQTDDNAGGPYSTDTGVTLVSRRTYVGVIVVDTLTATAEYYLQHMPQATKGDPLFQYLGSHAYAADIFFQPLFATQKTGGGEYDRLQIDAVAIWKAPTYNQ